MQYNVRRAQMEDLIRIEEIYAGARSFMARTGNPNQWGATHPKVEQLIQDINEGNLFVVADGGEIHGVFFFLVGPDPTYSKIENGNWHSDGLYGTIHRIAGDGSGGILRTAVAYGFSQAHVLRIDTHRDNLVMQRALKKLNFQKCGTIYLADGDPRIAYDCIMQW